MSRREHALEALAQRCGIGTEYHDIWGGLHRTSAETQRRLLAAMGLPDEGDPADYLADLDDAEWRSRCPPVQVVRRSAGRAAIDVAIDVADEARALTWTLVQEGGRRYGGEASPADLALVGERRMTDVHLRRRRLPLAELPPLGYHHVEFRCGEAAPLGVTCLIVVPDRCFQPRALEGRVWGPVLQLYSLRSQRNWGIGDFTDLAHAVECAASLGASLVGVNPTHALFPHNPGHASPYSPSSRLFLNVLYIDCEAVAESQGCAEVSGKIADPQFQAGLRALRAREHVDYGEVARHKIEVLGELYTHFRREHLGRDSEPARAFRRYQTEQGRLLRLHALYQALQDHFHERDPKVWGWPVWPEDYRDAASPKVAAFEREHLERVELWEYLQWQAERQLGAAGRRSEELRLGIGIYQDLAVSADGAGADVWAHPALYARDARIGAPPDDFNLKGQDWGLPPMRPMSLRAAAYQPFRAMLQRNMRHAGALRIDHVMGLMRQFWVPGGGTPIDGAYVAYPFQDLLGVLALESQRQHCVVIGEDLGTVPPEVREALAAHGVLSYRLLYFERAAGGGFKAPAEYPEQALVSVTTHDLATLSGYWQGVDLDLRTRLDLFPSAQMRERQLVARAQDLSHLLVALEREGLLPPGVTVHPTSLPEMTPELCRAVHRYLSRAPSKVLAVQPEDVFGQPDQVNLPGTVDEYPNWRRKLVLNLEDWAADPRMLALAEALRPERGGRPELARGAAGAGPVPVPTRIPDATYRFQFNAGFRFADAGALVPYLERLGVSHCYASPYLKARPGSTHGYDIIDHDALNPEIGSAEEYDRFTAALTSRGLGQVLDIVPNHMGLAVPQNRWWMDVLENGEAAQHAGYFDIDWRPASEQLRGKVLLPVLGGPYGVVLENGELRLAFDAGAGAFLVRYFEHAFPVDPRTYALVLARGTERLVSRLGPEDAIVAEYQSVTTALANLPARHRIEAEARRDRYRDKEIHKRSLAELCRRSPDVAWLIDELVAELNGTPHEPSSMDPLDRLLGDQAFRLAYWRVASDDINYRRFFDINDLAGLRMELPQVFEDTHRFVIQLVASGKVDGLRIDHPDGLFDPQGYFQRLQDCFTSTRGDPESAAKPLYVVAEKILERYERLPEDWPVHGTTGYEFANAATGLFVDPASEEAMEAIYTDFIGAPVDFDGLLYRSKRLIMRVALASELNVLASRLCEIAQSDRRTRDFTLNRLRETLEEIVASFPVYRTYVTRAGAAEDDVRYVDWAVNVAKKRSTAADTSVFDFVREVLLATIAGGKTEQYRRAVLQFAMKFQQYTGPVMAKGLEDTSFYIYNRLAALNEVGGDPHRYGVSVSAFHHGNLDRARRWPHAMLSTSTHDSKRSEDVRARIAVLSELPQEWRHQLERWGRLNASKRRIADGEPAPSRNDEYLLYQTLLGAWPLEEMDGAALEAFAGRIESYMLKVVKEAKVKSSWINPNTEYEQAIGAFVRALLEPREGNRFLAELAPFARRLARYGLFNALGQVVLKLTSPGVPDVYQGNELWDFSLVDPDNRRPVDYGLRQRLLGELEARDDGRVEQRVAHGYELLQDITGGRIKLFVTWKTLAYRRRNPELFRDGDYRPLEVAGEKAGHLCAFARTRGGRSVLVAVPRLPVGLLGEAEQCPLGHAVWGDTTIRVASGTQCVNLFTGEAVSAGDAGELPVAKVLAHFPVAVMEGVAVPEGEERA